MPIECESRWMRVPVKHLIGALSCIALLSACVISPLSSFSADTSFASLPEGVKPVWDITKASRESTSTRERICLNGLWRWQPSTDDSDTVPASNWGFFKVPGSWPGITDYMQKDCQTVYAHPD
jgi:hypothetical protein